MLNKVTLIGNLGRDPELRHTPEGKAVCALSLATTERWKGADGERKEATEWHRLVLWERLAEIAGEYLAQGARVYIEGKLKTRKYTDKDGVERHVTEIVVSELKMLGDRGDSQGDGQQRSQRQQPAPQQQQRPPQRQQAPQRQQQRAAAPAGFDDMDDDIPF